ncbi:Ig domain-containing protein, partial [Pseudoscardovia radai]
SRASVTVGQTTQLAAVVAPSNATNKAVTWTVRDPAIATVDTNGVVTALTVGATTVTVTTVDGKKSASALVLVTAKPVVET